MTNEELVLQIRNAVSPAELMLQLWKQNYGLIYKIANRYKSLDDIEDLLQEGFLGLYEAVRHYNPDIGGSFCKLCSSLDPADHRQVCQA